MKNKILPVVLMITGLALIYEPIVAMGNCGVNPAVYLPSKCMPPFVMPPMVGTGICMRLTDGTCFSMGCSGFVYENASPGLCGPATVTENNVPRCEQSFAATAVQVKQYAVLCSVDCMCKGTLTGATTTVTVCNCRDLEPGH